MSNELFLAVAGNAAGAGEATYVEDVFSTYLYTGNGSTQRIENGIAIGDSFSSGSVRLDGDNDNLNIASDTTLDFGTGDFTVEGWFYMDSATGGDGNLQTFFSVGAYNSNGILWRYKYFQFGGYTSDLSVYTAAGQWNHLAVVRNGSGASNVKIYVNGTAVASTTQTVSHSSASDVYIGTSAHAPSTECLQGNVSNFRMVKGTPVYTSNFTPPTSALTAVSGTSLLTCQSSDFFVDNSTNAHTVNTTGDAVAQTFGPFTSDTPGKGGLVWARTRGTNSSHALYDTERGVTNNIFTNSTAAEASYSGSLTSFNSDGFTLGSDTVGGLVNYVIGEDHASWTFAKQEKFFDVVTYTGTGSAQNISHNLGSTPGMIIIKDTSGTNHWIVGHRSLDYTTGKYLILSSTAAAGTTTAVWNSTAPTSSVFTVGTSSTVNTSGNTYVAYLFAHNDGDGGFGENGDQDIIKCGSYEGSDHRSEEVVELGFEPQFVLIKNIDGTRNWQICDIMRGMSYGSNSAALEPNTATAEALDAAAPNPTATGFFFPTRQGEYNEAGSTFIYIAIRRGPMKTPESGTEVFATDITYSSTSPQYYSGFPVDFWLRRYNRYSTDYFIAMDRLRANGNLYLATTTTAAESLFSGTGLAQMDGADLNGTNKSYAYMFRRAPGFLDVVAYTGTGSATTINHNLGVAPELMIIKSRDVTRNWAVYAGDETDYLVLNKTDSSTDNDNYWNDTAPTSSVFTVGADTVVNNSGENYIAYLFATVPGVSKVGSFVGDATNGRVIDCGFTNGARFVMMKKASTTGNWIVYDTERGIASVTEPYLFINTTGAEVTGTDYIDPASSGFAVNSPLNTTDTWIFLAIA